MDLQGQPSRNQISFQTFVFLVWRTGFVPCYFAQAKACTPNLHAARVSENNKYEITDHR